MQVLFYDKLAYIKIVALHDILMLIIKQTVTFFYLTFTMSKAVTPLQSLTFQENFNSSVSS